MEDKEKNQKTVVAFIAGLLIGGLLVWVFSMTPGSKPASDASKGTIPAAENTSSESKNDAAATDTSDVTGPNTVTTKPISTVVAKGAGSVSVDDQNAAAAGAQVVLGSVTMPVENGWLVVHEVNTDGSLGNALGASRYSEKEGLKPTGITLLRGTKSGTTYRVVAYSENGDRTFDLAEDAPITTDGGMRIEDTFVAK